MSRTKYTQRSLPSNPFDQPLCHSNSAPRPSTEPDVDVYSLQNYYEENNFPLHRAALADKLCDITNVPIKEGADINDANNKYKQTPLMVACVCHNLPAVKFLLEKGANVNAVNGNNKTCLQLMLSKGVRVKACPMITFGICKCLVDAGIDVENRDDSGESVLHACCQNNSYAEIAIFLINQGATFLARSDNGITPLMYACINDNYHVINYVFNLTSCSIKTQVDMWKVKGAHSMLKGNTAAGFRYWNKALEMSENEAENSAIVSAHPLYAFKRSFKDVVQAGTRGGSHEERKHLALKLVEVLVSPTCPWAQKWLRTEVCEYLYHNNYEKCVSYSMHAYEMAKEHSPRADPSYLFKALVEIFGHVQQLVRVGFRLEQKHLGLLVTLFGESIEHFLSCPFERQKIGKRILNVMKFASLLCPQRSIMSESDIRRILDSFRTFVAINNTRYKKSILQLALNPSVDSFSFSLHPDYFSDIFEYSYMFTPQFSTSVDLIKFIVEAGADLHDLDDGHNTALHYSARFQGDNPELLDFLLESGCSYFARNADGKTFRDVKRFVHLAVRSLEPMNYLSLKYLARSAILTSKIPKETLKQILPNKLCFFLNLC